MTMQPRDPEPEVDPRYRCWLHGRVADESNERWWHHIFDYGAEVTGYAGLTEAEATEKARASGYMVRILRSESKAALGSERVMPRINLLVDAEGRVLRAAEF